MSDKEFESRDVLPLNYRWATRVPQLMKTLGMLSLLFILTAGVRGQSALDGFDPNANGTIHVVVVQPDGKILLGGDFTTLSPNGGAAVTRNHIARLNHDGTLDAAFDPNANSSVRSMVVQADGKILVGGFFHGVNSIGGQARNSIARLEAATGLADSFDPNADDGVYSIALQADGKILAGGNFQGIGGQPRNRIARLDPTTGQADSFDPNASSVVVSIAVQADGKILAGGNFWGFNSIGHQPRYYIARLDPVTGLADSFNPMPDNQVFSIAIQADGRILVGGGFLNIGGQTRHRIARLNPTTGLADSFDPNADEGVIAIVVQTDGKVLAGGFFTGVGGQARNHIARLDPVTGFPDSFDPNAGGSAERVYAIAQQADGKILAGGEFLTFTPNGGAAVTRNRIARLEIDGRLDQTLDLGIVPTGNFWDVFALAVQRDGKILIGGNFTNVLGVPRNFIARLNSDGTLDTAFNPDADDWVTAIVLQADGKILAGGHFNSIGGQERNHIARLDATTGLADSFDPNVDDVVNALAVQADGKILVGGNFAGANSIGGQTRNRIARIDPATGLVDSFDPNANDRVYCIVVQPDGKILLGGGFNGVDGLGGQTRNRMARIDATTGLPDSFSPNANNVVRSIAVQADGKVLAGGVFTAIGGQVRSRLARLDATTGLADSFDPNAIGTVISLGVQTDGKILASGSFTGIAGLPRPYIARLDPATGLADSFDPRSNGRVYANVILADGKILVGGGFGNIGGQARRLFARLTNDAAPLQNLTVAQTAITWTRGGSSPLFTRTGFEYSIDNVNYAPLGNGTPAGGNWVLAGLNLPVAQNFYIRARGYRPGGYNNGSETVTESVWAAFVVPPSTLGNISTRLRVLSGDNALIGGMIATGTAPKRVILRAIGPTLTDLGVPGALTDPTLELYQGNTLLLSNDDWRISSQEAEIKASGFAPNKDLESAIIWTLTPGQGYTAIVRGKNGETGIGVVEAYDLDHAAASKLGNISTRGFVDVGDNAMIAGLIVTPNNGTSARILVRALGPTLTDLGVPEALANPTLDLVNSSGTIIRSNNDWKDDPLQRSAIEAAGLAPNHDEEAALVETVAPGAYTAIVRGTGPTPTGVALVEVYHLP